MSDSSWTAPRFLADPYAAVRNNMGIAIVVALGLIAWATLRWATGPNAMPRRRQGKYFDAKSKKFESHRRKHFPPPFPNGWYHIANSAEVEKGKVVSISCLGREFVIFRGEDGRVTILDAFCPHLGAHLGDGQVKDNTLACPFHGWRFDTSGKCVEIPYMPEGSEVPAFAKTKQYSCDERWGIIFVWFDAENRPPLWQLPDVPQLTDGSTYYGGNTEMVFEQYISEMAENSADWHHFNTLHAPFPLKFLGPLQKLFSLHHTILLEFPYKDEPGKQHMCIFNLQTQMLFLNRIHIGPPQKIVSTFVGPSIMLFEVFGPMGTVRSIKTLLPVEPFKQQTYDIWWADKTVPRWYGSLVAYIAAGALEQDRQVWANKSYVPQPMLVKGDGPFMAHRRWYGQFYSEHSRDVAQNGGSLTDW
ncbi:hypothetical protein DFJ74DRAFT_307077 [Hyaloraphidium curvatum]|nr:hypothetical protein DFJ74DRAFT_307077 [Hyaloraphidium curvatum]